MERKRMEIYEVLEIRRSDFNLLRTVPFLLTLKFQLFVPLKGDLSE